MKTYKLLEYKEIKSMGIKVFLYKHIKTEATVTYVKSKDRNKTFAIGFKTPPTDSKGKAHIMEHSVLNGSRKFKTKEPFMDMASSSLQTFLNAMTYPDKTIYPVSSENDKDFFNLTDVYLDAVFNPRVLEKKEIFMQEGWHYKIDDNNNLDISGVVYNEMKGALTDPDTMIYNDIVKNLYKNSPYEYISGGDPYEIPKISYEEFVDFYKDHYHPSNSRIYLYGDLDIEYYLDYIDKEYLSKYDYKKIDKDIEVVENTYDKVIETTYPSSKEDEDLSYLSYAFLTNDARNLKEALTLNILSTVLFNLDSSKISNRVYKEIKPESFFARTGYGTRSSIIIQAQKTNRENLDKFVDIIEDGIKKASEEISKDALKAGFSILDFSVRNQMNSTSKGLEYFLMSSMYADELGVFDVVKILDELKDLIDTSYYEDFVKKYFLDNKTKLVMIASPSKTYTAEKLSIQEKEIQELKKSFTEEDFEKIRKEQESFKAFQERKDTEEEKATIPKLEISDVDTEIKKIPRLVENDGYEFVFHDFNTAGLLYTSFYFNINDFSLEDLKYAQVVSDFIGAVDTKNYSYGELDNIIWTQMASFTSSVSNIKIEEKVDKNFRLTIKTTKDKYQKALSLVKEIISESSFNSKDRILEILRQRKSVFEMSMYDSAHIIAMNRNLAHFDKFSFIKEEINGISYYLFIKELIKQVEEDFDTFLKRVREIYQKIFSQNISINIAGPEKDHSFLNKTIKDTFKDLNKRVISNYEIDFEKSYRKEAILTDANVNYVSMGADLKDFGQKYTSLLSLGSSIISNPYLYELIRAKGGAYGAGMTIDKSSNMATYSYRDPNIRKTIDAFSKIGQLTKSMDLTQRDFTNQKIAKMGSLLRPKSPFEQADFDYVYYKKGLDEKETQKYLEDIKNASLEDIKAFSEPFQKAVEADNIVVFGNRDQILEEKDYFDQIIELDNWKIH